MTVLNRGWFLRNFVKSNVRFFHNFVQTSALIGRRVNRDRGRRFCPSRFQLRIRSTDWQWLSVCTNEKVSSRDSLGVNKGEVAKKDGSNQEHRGYSVGKKEYNDSSAGRVKLKYQVTGKKAAQLVGKLLETPRPNRLRVLLAAMCTVRWQNVGGLNPARFLESLPEIRK